MQTIPRAELPLAPKDPERWLKIIRVQSNQRLSMIALENELFQCFVHWDEEIGRNWPCFGKDACPRCGPNAVRIWQGYLACASLDMRTRFVMEITQGCARGMVREGLLSQSLYGKELTLFRKPKKNSKNGPVLLVGHGESRAASIPPRVDSLKSLLRLWSWNEEHEAKLRAKFQTLREMGREEVRRMVEEFPV